jgi:hypothetical protein
VNADTPDREWVLVLPVERGARLFEGAAGGKDDGAEREEVIWPDGWVDVGVHV